MNATAELPEAETASRPRTKRNTKPTALEEHRAELAERINSLEAVERELSALRQKRQSTSAEIEKLDANGAADVQTVTKLRALSDLIDRIDGKVETTEANLPQLRAALRACVETAAEGYREVVKPRVDKRQAELVALLKPYYRPGSTSPEAIAGRSDFGAYCTGHLALAFARNGDPLTVARWFLPLIDRALVDPAWLPWPSPQPMPA